MSIHRLKKSVDKLKSLLDDPHMGLSSWQEMANQSLKEIGEFYNEVKAKSKEKREEEH
jgi:hypothetical protein